MKTVQTNVYTFEELDDAAKENARNWYRQAASGDDDFADWVFEDAKEIAERLGIEFDSRAVKLYGGGTRYEPAIAYSGFWSQGDGASFKGTYRYRKGSVKAVTEYAPKDEKLHRIAEGLAAIQKQYFYKLRATIGSNDSRYAHEYTMAVSVYQDDNDTYAPDEVAETVTELLRDFARWIYRQLEESYEHTQSDEYVDDAIIANEYEFLDTGDSF